MLDVSSLLIVFFTIAIMTFIFKENPVFRFAEHTFVGFAGAHWLLMAFSFIQANAWEPLIGRAKFIYIIPFCFGALLFARLIPKARWLSRWSIALIIGAATGISITSTTQTDIVNQIRGSMLPLTSFANVIQLVCVITVLIFFMMTRLGRVSEKLDPVGKLGRYFLMLGLGASFGNVIMSRMAFLAGRFLELMQILGLVRTV